MPVQEYTPTLASIRGLIAEDMQAVETLMKNTIHESEIDLIQEVSEHILTSGGKRIRPMLTLLCAKAMNSPNNAHIQIAALVEFIHTASLLHDDVVDASLQRRGQHTANTIWGNAATILVGDFLYSTTFQMLIDTGHLEVMQAFSTTTRQMAMGEVLQLTKRHDPCTTEADYLDIIRCKTAVLFAIACELSAIITNNTSLQAPLKAYGYNLGMAFQLIDDKLDYCGDPDALGKNIGDDLAEGKPTLPLLHALQHGNADTQKLVENAIRDGQVDKIEQIVAAVTACGALDYVQKLAEQFASAAAVELDKLPESPYKQALEDLIQLSVTRSR